LFDLAVAGLVEGALARAGALCLAGGGVDLAALVCCLEVA